MTGMRKAATGRRSGRERGSFGADLLQAEGGGAGGNHDPVCLAASMLPVKLAGLLAPSRYKIAYGGRGSAK